MSNIVALLVRHDTPLVWLNVFLEQIGVPIPAVPTLVVAGALSRDGKMSSTLIVTGAVLASLLADWIWFLLGRRMGYRVLRVLCVLSLSPDSCVRDTDRVARMLIENGFHQVRPLAGGLEAWMDAGYPVDHE